MKKKTKTTAIIVLLLLIVIGGLVSWHVYDTYDTSCRVAKQIIENADPNSKYFDKDHSDWSGYHRVKNSFIFEKVLNSALSDVINRGEEFDTKFAPRVRRLCISSSVLEKLDYKKESTKEVLTESIKKAADIYLEEHSLSWLIRAMDAIQYTEYYCSRNDIMSKEYIISEFTKLKNDAFASPDPILFGKYVQEVATLIDTLPNISTEELLTPEEAHAFLEKTAEKAIIKNGIGGYYDSMEESRHSSTTSIQSTIVSSKSYYGDFYVSSFSETMYRPTGEDWEDEVLSKHDTNSSTLYYKGEKISSGAGWFLRNAITSTAENCAVYVYNTGTNKSMVIVSSEYIICQSPNVEIRY